MKKVDNQIEALMFCEEYQCEIKFRNESCGTPKHVTVSLNAWTQVAGKDLVEAVNRLVKLYHTAPIEYGKLDWWDGQKIYGIY